MVKIVLVSDKINHWRSTDWSRQQYGCTAEKNVILPRKIRSYMLRQFDGTIGGHDEMIVQVSNDIILKGKLWELKTLGKKEPIM